MDRTINVLVTAVGNMGVGDQIIKALRHSNLSLSIVGIDISSFDIKYKELDFFYIVPICSDEEKIQRITKIIKKHSIDIIFVGCENDYMFLNRNRTYFEEISVYLAINSVDISSFGFNKQKTYDKLREKGIEVPGYWKINSVEDCKQIDTFPVVLKPNSGTSASKNIFVVFSTQELISIASYMLSLNIDIIAQEYVGNENSEYTISVTSDKDGTVIGSIIIKRNFDASITYREKIRRNGHNYTVASGITQGNIVHNLCIKKEAEKIAKTLDSRFSLNIQAMVVDNRLLVIEIHPTLTGSVFVRALAGYNEPENIIRRELLNEHVTYEYNDVRIIRSLECKAIQEGDNMI